MHFPLLAAPRVPRCSIPIRPKRSGLDRDSASASLTLVSMKLYDLDPGPESPELVRMIVEIPMGSANKVE